MSFYKKNSLKYLAIVAYQVKTFRNSYIFILKQSQLFGYGGVNSLITVVFRAEGVDIFNGV